jgi:hypothetical protein
VRRFAAGSDGPALAPPIVHEVLRSPGQPLDAATRAFMEPRFGHDFSRVRVHADAQASESAQAVHALAYTVGQDVVFRSGQYQPQTAGRHLLAHELVHVVQQTPARLSPLASLAIAGPQHAGEQHVDSVARQLLTRERTSAAPVARSADPTSGEGLLFRQISDSDRQACIDTYVNCVQGRWGPGRCDNCLHYCTAHGYWPFNRCKPGGRGGVPQWVWALLGAGAAAALAACFATGVCELGAIVAGLGAAARAAIIWALEAAGVTIVAGPRLSSTEGRSGDSDGEIATVQPTPEDSEIAGA